MDKRLNIGLNLLYMNTKLAGGSITYGINLVNELAKLDKFNNYVVYVNKDCADLPISLGHNFKFRIIPFHNKHVYVRYFWEQLLFPFFLLKDRLDLLHSLGYVGPILCPTKHISSILDLNYKRHADSMSTTKKILLGTMVKLTSIFTKHIITISNFSKMEICEGLNVKPGKVTVTHLSGSNDQPAIAAAVIDLKTKYNIEENYIIAFGSPSSHKNIVGLIAAFAELTKDYDGIQLVLVGHQHSNKELNDRIAEFNLTGKVSFTGFVPDEHVFPLLTASKLFVFPSFYEGFGIPLLDAQSAGVPVASSNAASLPEVGNDGALYFDPYSIIEMTKVMNEILKNESLSKNLIQKGLINRSKFAWRTTARETLDCYKLITRYK